MLHAVGGRRQTRQGCSATSSTGRSRSGLTTRARTISDRTTAGKNSRHVDRKVYKMRELQNAGKVRTVLVPTKDMRSADQTA